MNSIAKRLRCIRENMGISQTNAASKFGIPASTYRKYESGPSEPGSDALAGIARLGISINWVLTGEGSMLLDELKPLVDDHNKSASGIHMALGVSEPTTELAQAPHGFVLVPRYDVAASMGNGSVIHSEQIVDHLAFREEWVRTELGANPKNLLLISAIGDSMEPTLRAGDLLLIDCNGVGVKQDAIYAFATNGELRVKRMQLKLDGSVVVKSDNQQYEPETLSADNAVLLHIIGRVVWSGRRM